MGSDGYDYIGSIRMAGALESEDVEMFELSYGWAEITALSYWPDSGGAGQWRGGLGSYAEMVLLGENMTLAAFGTGRDRGAYGLFGGHESPTGRLLLSYPDGTEEDVPAMASIRDIPPGTTLRKWNTGGGGHGDPALRSSKHVDRDVREGYVSLEQAQEVYGYQDSN